MAEVARRARPLRPGRADLDAAASVADLDLRVLRIVSEQRVVTQGQLELLLHDVPARTLRYRTARLGRLGLVGRTRPYRDRGSAPFHLWPTRRGDALVRGGPPPRGGERREPNPTFVAHAAALTGFYVALATMLAEGVRLVSFAREGEAREPFRWRDGRRRAIAPDARIDLDDDGRRLVGFLEVDLGTMSHRRLRAKARGYADYARADAWREAHDFCPGLLFATIAERRAGAFLEALVAELGADADLFACARALTREPVRAVAEPAWQTTGGGGRLDLAAALAEARRPYDEEQADWERTRQRDRAARDRLLGDPVALREHLRHQRRGLPERVDGAARIAVELLLEGDGEPTVPERRALRALGALLTDPLLGRWADREPDTAERETLAELVAHHHARQLDDVAGFAERLGDGPALRQARQRLEAGQLLSVAELRWLATDAQRDRQSRATQERFRAAYLERREEEARRLAKAQGLTGRMRHGPDEFLAAVDRRLLRVCPRCEEITYPGADDGLAWAGPGASAEACHFCGQGSLAPFEASE